MAARPARAVLSRRASPVGRYAATICGRVANQAAAAAVTSNGWLIGRSAPIGREASSGGRLQGYSSSILFCQFMLVILIE